MDDIILIGYGGHGKSVADCIERKKEYRIVGYTDFKSRKTSYKYLGTDDILEEVFKGGVKNAAVGIGYMGKGNIRETIYKKLKKIGFNLPVICDSSSIISSTAQIGEGVFVGKGSIINTEAIVERMAIINTNTLIEHECIVEEYAHIAVGAVLCGQVKIGKSSFVGANSTIIQQRKVESYSIIPAGAIIR